jgi:aryl-alcohol dehydrogenase-like predicted oxidoreductase
VDTALPTSPLGTTDMAVTRVGFGAWAIGGGDWAFGWGAQDDAESIAAIRHAVEQGVNWIDTAAVYGLGHSEEVVAKALAPIPDADRPLVFTKSGLVWDVNDHAARSRRIGSPASIRREAEDSLRRLQVERIDLLQMHWPTEDGSSIDDYWSTLLALKDEGKVRAVGLSNHAVAELDEAEAIGHVDTLQPPLSPINRAAASDVVPWCHAHGTGVIVYSPMASGLLSGRWSEVRSASLDPTDWRTGNPSFHGEALARALALADGLRPIADRHDVSVGAVAIAWTLAFPGVTGAIVGARDPAQVDGWLAAAALELDETDLAAVAAAITNAAAGTGPTRP